MKQLAVALALVTLGVAWAQAETEAEADDNAPRVGDALPAFRLNDHEGQAVSVGGERPSWTVVAFYPKALTPG